MIALIIWSRAAAALPPGHFDSHLSGFHQKLASSRSQGFRTSACFRTEPPPWAPWNPPVFEDWYVVSNFAAIDHMIEAVKAADAADASSSHTHLIQHTEKGAGAIFGLRLGRPQLAKTPHAWWFDALPAVDVEAHVRTLDLPGRGVEFSLWGRSLGLGPMKFCLQASAPLGDWAPFETIYRDRTLLASS